MDKVCYIYTLTDPNTLQVRYVGKTINPEERFKRHRLDKKGCNLRINWIKSLRAMDLFPIFEVVDVVDNAQWEFWEQHWITLFKSWNFNLVNANAKGSGAINFKHSNETKEKIRATSLNRRHSNETKEMISKNRMGMKFSAQHIENLSKSHLCQTNEKFRKKVAQINKSTGNIIKIYDSIIDAERVTGVFNSSITKCCKNTRESAGGFTWKYVSKNKNNASR